MTAHPNTLRIAGFAALLALTFAATANAAGPAARRLEIRVEASRDAALTGGVDRGRSRLTQSLVLTALLQTDGTPMPHNPLDPDDARRQAERAQRTAQRVQTALDRQRGQPAAAAPDMAAMQVRAQQMQAKCGQDRDCLMREAQAFAAVQASGGHAGVQARLAGYGQAVQACERQHAAAKAREACIANARRQAGGGDEDEADDEVETPYLYFSGPAACRFEAAVKIDERTEGQFDDVQGAVPFTHTAQADQRRRDDTVCPMLQAVLDTRSGRLWTHALGAVAEAPGVTVRAEKGRKPQRWDGPVRLDWREADAWMQQRLLKLDTGGTDRVQLPAPGQGRTDVQLRWSFAPA